jgi:hypothetical protein
MTDQVSQEEKLPELNEQDLLDLNIGIVPAITIGDHTPIIGEQNNPIQMLDGSLMGYKHDHIMHWLNNDVYLRTINLPQDQKDRYFQMITDYGDIIAHLMNDDNNVIYEYVRGNEQPWMKLENHAKKSNMVIDYERPAQLIKEYNEWRKRKNLA